MKEVDMKKKKEIPWKIIGIAIVSIIFYAYILVCFGLVGPASQDIALLVGKYLLKYGSILFGFFLAGFLPFRIHTALKAREKRKYDIESERKILEAARRKKQIDNKVMNEYIKNEDAI